MYIFDFLSDNQQISKVFYKFDTTVARGNTLMTDSDWKVNCIMERVHSMNKIYKVIYSKVRNCYVVVSELAKNQRKCHSVNVKGKTALAAAILLALTSFCLTGMPSVAQAADGTESLRNNDFVGANDQYWYYDEDAKEWKTYQYKLTSAFNNRARGDLPNYQGGGAKFPGAVTAGLYAQAGQQTVTIGDRNAGQSKGSVFIGEHSGYNNGNNDPAGMKNNYVTSVGFQSDATGWGSIAIGSNAIAENSKMESQVVKEVGKANTSGTVSDDTYGIEENPTIQGASVALGYNAHSKDGNIAIGSYSDATSTDKGDSYVSVGNGTLKRRITNVAKGADNSDVVTVGQMNDAIKQADNLNVNAGWGINVADENDPTNTGKGTKNVISLKHNLGTGYNDDEANGMIIGGLVEDRDSAKQYGAADANSVIVGAGKALASGKSSVVVGGLDNVASGATSVVVGGDNNNAAGNQSAVFGGRDNTAAGIASTAGGGIMNVANGQQAVALGGAYNYALGTSSTAIGGTGGNGMYGYSTSVNGNYSVSLAGGSTGTDALNGLAAGNQSVVTTANGTAVGYQATTDKEGTIAFGHDAGDVSGYAVTWKQRTDGKTNADHTTNDYTQVPDSVTPTTYKDAYYNRLVKAADGIDAHDAVVMEQLKPYTKSDASNIGANLKTYTVGDDGETITETDATADQKKTNKDDWGKALGAEKFTTGTDTTATNASTSEQLVTGKTLYNYDAPVAETGKKLNYVSANNTTGQNLLNLDRQVKTNTDTLSDVNSRSVKYDTKTENGKTVVDNTKITLAGEGGTTITNLKDGVNANDAATVGQMNTAIGNAKTKYYSVHEGPQIAGFSTNEKNNGASALAGLAAGYETGTAGVGSTVVGSYSGVMNTGTTSSVDLRGAASISLGTLNLNQNNDTSKTFSGVANSIVGQGNMTTNSNAAIIIGAGNTITDSYKDVDINTSTMKGSTPAELEDALQKAVPESGAQVMAIGGGNKITSAYKTQVVGLGNTVSGTELNYVEGFNNTVTGGTSNYIIGAQNNLTGGSKNIVFGDNHTLSNKSNNVVIGSADSSKELAASGAVVIGHNADVSVDNGVALGSDSVASVKEGQKGYDPAKKVENKTKEPWTSTKAAVSVGKADGSVTRQITGVAAGTNDTDAVNVAQIKKLASVDASNIGKNFKDGDVTTNEKAWGEALGTGTVTKDDDGSKQLVTGGTVYNEVRPSKDGEYVKMSQTTGTNLIALDDQVKTNTDKLSDVDSRSVKYDTKKVNGKTVVDNTKITLAGEGGTTITNLKDGVNANDAATMGQLNAKISGVTYKAGDGIKYDTDAENNKTISVNKGDGLKFTEDHKLAVNTGKHLSVNTDGQIDVGDNGAVAENDGNLVTGDTVYKALNGGMTKMIIGTPGKDGKDGKDGTRGTIGLVGPAGTNGKDGAVDITIQKGEDGKDGTKGANGVDGKDGINRIVYEDKNGKHQVATMEDGLKFAGDDGQKEATKAIAKKLNNTVDIIGGADSTKLTANNIGVNNVDGKLKIQLAQELTGITSISGSTGSNGAKITLDTNDQNISVNGGKITDVASGLSTNDGSYNAEDANNAANISDVNSMISKAVTDAKGKTQQDLDKKANVDASNIGTNLKGTDGKTAATEDEQKANLDKWGEAIGTGEVKDGSKQLVTGETVYNAVKDKADKSYVDDQLKTKANTDGSNIDADKFSKNVAIGEVNDTDERAVSGKTVQKAIDGINSDMTTKLNGKANVSLDNITDAGKAVIKDQARDAVKIAETGVNTNVVATQDETNHTTTYTINVEGNGKVAAKDTGLISGDTLYNEVRPASDGNYIKITNTTAQNITNLDTQVKKNSDMVNSDGSTIRIGGKDTATKVDVSDKNGSGRVITGVVTDTNDASSAANVGYVNNMAAANTQQIYRDMNNAYGRLDNNINRAAAGSNALAALHPLEYDPDDKLSFAMGYGHYHNANAAAVGAFYQPNSKTQFNFGVALGNGDPGFNAGIAFKLGKSSPYAGMNRVTLIHTVQDLKASDEAKDKRIDALEKENQEMKKQLQAILAKLNG